MDRSEYKIKFSLHSVLFILSITGVIFSLVVISVLLHYMTGARINDWLNVVNETKFNQVASDLEYFFDSTAKSVDYLQNNKQLLTNIRIVNNNETPPFERYRLLSEIDQILLNIQAYNEHIKSINIVTDKLQYYVGGYLYNYKKNKNYGLVDSVRLQYSDSLFKAKLPEGDNLFYRSPDQQVYYYTVLEESGQPFGELYVFLHDDKFANRLPGLANVRIVDDKGRTVFKGEHSKDTDNPAKSDEILNKQLSFHNWTVMYHVDIEIYREQSELLRQSAYLALVICLLVTLFLSGYLSKQILLPAVRLISLLKLYNFGNGHIADAVKTRKSARMRLTLREKVFYYLIVTILLPVCCFVAIFFLQSNKIIQHNMKDSYSQMFQKTAGDVNSFMEKKEKLLMGLSFSNAVQNAINNHIYHAESIGDTVEQFIYLGLHNDKFSLYGSDNHLIFSSGFRQAQSIEEPYLADLQNIYRGIVWKQGKDRNNKDMIMLGMNVVGLSNSRMKGYSVIEMDYRQFADVYTYALGNDVNTFILDLTEPNANDMELRRFVDSIAGKSGSSIIEMDGERRLLFYEKIGFRNLYLVTVIKGNSVYEFSFADTLYNIYVVAVFFIILVLLSFVVSWYLLKPVHRMNEMFDFAKSGRFEIPADHDYYISDIQELHNNFIRMIERIEDLIEDMLILNSKKHKVEIEKKTAEIRALQAQINPHFLQNTLDNTVYMIKNDHKEQAVTMIQSLSSLFRFGIGIGENMINIQEELKHVKAYVNIMNIRHSNQIHFVWHIDESLLQYKTLKLTLQPIIENAITHGVFHKMKEATIVFECRSEGDCIQFRVTDNGSGIPEQKYAKLMARLNSVEYTDENIGLFNVQNRIRLYFGAEFGLSILTAAGRGTTVVLTIPKLDDVKLLK